MKSSNPISGAVAPNDLTTLLQKLEALQSLITPEVKDESTLLTKGLKDTLTQFITSVRLTLITRDVEAACLLLNLNLSLLAELKTEIESNLTHLEMNKTVSQPDITKPSTPTPIANPLPTVQSNTDLSGYFGGVLSFFSGSTPTSQAASLSVTPPPQMEFEMKEMNPSNNPPPSP